MMLDKQTLLCDAQAVTVTAVSANAIDLGVKGVPKLGGGLISDPGRGTPVEILCQVVTLFEAAGAATMVVDLIVDDDAALGSPTKLNSTPAIPVASLVAGYQFRIGGTIPPGIADADRYLGVQFTIATGPMTAGKITAGIVMDKQTNTKTL